MNVFELMAKISLDTSGYTKSLDTAKKAAGTVAKVGVAAFAAVGTAAVGAGVKLVKETANVASYGDNIDKMSQKMGISAKAYQEWDAVMQHSGTSINALKPSMKTMANQAQQGAEEFQKLGISQEEVKTLSQEDLFGRVIEGLQNMEEGTERTAIASKLLGRGATELGALLNTSAEDTQKMKDRVNELGGVMTNEAVKAAAAYQDQLQDMQTAIQGVKRNLLSGMMPAITTVMAGITELASGNVDLGLEQISQGIEKVAQQVTKIMPKVIKTIVTILPQIGKALIQNINAVVPYIPEMIKTLVDAAANLLPDLTEIAIQIVKQLSLAIVDALPVLVEALPEIIKALANGIVDMINALPDILTMMESVIDTVCDTLIDLIPTLVEAALMVMEKVIEYMMNPENTIKLVEMAAKLIIAVAGGLLAAVPNLLAGIGKIITSCINNILSTNWGKLGQDMINSITGALQNASGKLMEWWDGWSKKIGETAVAAWNGVVSTWSKVGEFFAGIWTSIKNTFSGVATWFKDIFSNAWGSIKSIFAPAGATFQKIGETAVAAWNGVVDTWSKVGGFFSGIWTSIKNTFSGVATWFKDIFTKAWEGIKSIFAPVGTTFQNIGNSILNGLKSVVNGLIGGINNIINIPFEGLNAALRGIKGINIAGVKPFDWISEITVPQIPYLAKGGIVEKPTQAIIGEAGAEAVIPLENNTQWIDKLAEKIGKKGNSYYFTVNFDGNINNRNDLESLADDLMYIMQEKIERQGVAYG